MIGIIIEPNSSFIVQIAVNKVYLSSSLYPFGCVV